MCAAVNAADALAYMLTGLHASAVSILIIACSIICLVAFGTRVHKSLKDMSVQKSFILSGESIESVSGDIDSFLDAIGTGKQNRIRIRFTIEDALIRVWKSLGDPSMVKVTAGIRFNRPGIKIEYEGDSFNPFSKTKNQIDDWSSGLLSSAGLSPDYSYRHGTNMVRIPLARMSVNPIITGLLAILFGIVSGAVAFQLLSPADAQFVTKDLLVPVYDLWNNILFSVSAPAMFVIVMSTMLDTRDISEQGGNSGRILGRFFALMLILGLVTIAVAAPLRAESFSVGELNRYKVAEIISDLFGIIPENLMEPFKNFDTAQLILMGVIFAYAVMAVGDKADGIAAIIRQLNLISTQLAQWIAQLMPLFTVFLSARLVLERNGHLLIGLARVIPFALIMSLFCMTTMILYTCRRMNVYPGTLLRKLKPSFIETLRTGPIHAGEYDRHDRVRNVRVDQQRGDDNTYVDHKGDSIRVDPSGSGSPDTRRQPAVIRRNNRAAGNRQGIYHSRDDLRHNIQHVRVCGKPDAAADRPYTPGGPHGSDQPKYSDQRR